MGVLARKRPGWQQSSESDCSERASTPSLCITVGSVALQPRGKLGMLSHGMQ